MAKADELVLWFDQLGIEDVPLVGGKNASLGEMYRNLTNKGVKVPNGFAITAKAYFYLLESNDAMHKVKDILKDLNTHDMHNLQERGHKVRNLIKGLEFPEDLKQAIFSSYKKLCDSYKREHVDVAVRSSATAEDLPDASFAGQQETYLNIRGESQLIQSCKDCFASLFTNRAISYREDKGFDHFSIGLSIAVQKMVRSDKACSGVMFTLDTESGFRDVVFLTGSWGLGENIVQGAVNPDEYYVHKPTMKKGFKSIISKTAGDKKIMMIYDMESNKRTTKNIPVPKEKRKQFVLDDDEILTMAKWGAVIEDYYTIKRKKYTPMDIEWAKDGETGELFIVQARPETIHSQKDMTKSVKYKLEEKSNELIFGKSVGSRIGAGKVNIIKDAHQIHEFKKGEVLVTDMTDPDWEPIMKIASAIVTNRGGRTCHAAIVSRELGIPCIVGTQKGTEKLKTGQEVTVDCSQGEDGIVWEGILNFKKEEMDLGSLPETKVKVMMNVGNPEQAFEFAQIPNQGVGLAREEFIINSHIGIHPLALIHFDELTDGVAKRKIEEATYGYEDKSQFFIDKLAEGIGTIGAAFYPREVIVRMSDFKSNEYANLVGGMQFEPKEENPMIGWRGASRYYDDNYREAFALECAAFKKVREEFGLINVHAMIPFCRTVGEAKKVLAEMEKNGLKQGANGLQVIGMCEIPSNVLLADEFLDVFDGFSIGTNDLTQLTLGMDRDSDLIANISNEKDAAVIKLLKDVIAIANKKKKYIGICGQAPSDFPFNEFGEMLVEAGIGSISLNPDTVVDMIFKIAEKEAK
ncbi:phosphoenolpyruvate synthase [Nanoarchaeota archaeon]